MWEATEGTDKDREVEQRKAKMKLPRKGMTIKHKNRMQDDCDDKKPERKIKCRRTTTTEHFEVETISIQRNIAGICSLPRTEGEEAANIIHSSKALTKDKEGPGEVVRRHE